MLTVLPNTGADTGKPVWFDLLSPTEEEIADVAPLAFVLSSDWLITIRFTKLAAFDAVLETFGRQSSIDGGLKVFTQLCEEIVDRVADGLEHIAESIDRGEVHCR